jgi:hypothetical protein
MHADADDLQSFTHAMPFLAPVSTTSDSPNSPTANFAALHIAA